MHYHNYKLLQFILCVGMVLWTFKWSFWQWSYGSNRTTLRLHLVDAVAPCFCDKPLGRGGWNLKPQLLVSHCAPARPTDLSTHLYLNNLYAFCLTEPQNHQREKQEKKKKKQPHPGDLLHILLAKKDTWKCKNTVAHVFFAPEEKH